MLKAAQEISPQKKVSILFCVITIAMFLVPPWEQFARDTVLEPFLGYDFIFSPPGKGQVGVQISFSILFVQLSAVLVAFVATMYLVKRDAWRVAAEIDR